MVLSSPQVHASMQALNAYYQSLRPWHFGWWFFPKAIAVELKRGGDELQRRDAAKNIFDIFLSVGRFFSFFYDFFFGHCFNSSLLESMQTLKKHYLLTSDNFDAVFRSQDPRAVSKALVKLNQAGLLTGDGAHENRNAVVWSRYPTDASDALVELNQAGLLSGEGANANRGAVVGIQDWHRRSVVINALVQLNQAGLLSGEGAHKNREAVVGIQDLDRIHVVRVVINALIELNRAGLLTGDDAHENRNAVVRSQNPSMVSHALVSLNQAGLLSGEGANANRDLLVRHPNSYPIADILGKLSRAGILTADNKQAYFDGLVRHAHTYQLELLVSCLNEAGLLTQQNYDQVLQYHEIWENLSWYDVNEHFFRGHPDRFTRMLAICQNNEQTVAERQQAVRQYVRHELGFADNVALNNTQSTHTETVHAATNATLWALSMVYQNALPNPEEVFEAIRAGITAAQETEPKQYETKWPERKEVALACLGRLAGSSMVLFLSTETKQRALGLIRSQDNEPLKALLPRLERDMGEGTYSLQQYIALLWHATEGNPEQIGAFISALYESERGYNLNDRGVDTGGESSPICYGGTANKFIECLSSLSPYIIFVMINERVIHEALKQALLKQTIEVLEELSKNNPQEFARQMDALSDDEQSEAVFRRIYDEANQAIQRGIFEQFDGAKEGLVAKVLTEFESTVLPYFDVGRFEPGTPYGQAFNALKEKRSELSVSANTSNTEFLALFGGAAFFQGEKVAKSTADSAPTALDEAERTLSKLSS